MKGEDMHRYLRAALVAPAALALVLAAAGCDDAEDQLRDAGEEVGEFAIRNAAAIAGTAKFENEGHPLDGRLRCTARVRGDDRATVRCNGRTEDGEPVTLEGEAERGEVRDGTYTGRVAGREVFSGSLGG
jgi:hypothetical protein